ncbi:MAG TPA: T9SS type A sorting domain-containing protein, partial [Candidatus Kapabacteria bacterium]
ETYTYMVWCPYDPDLLAIAVDLKDIFYNAGIYGYGNIYTYRLSTGECKRITPQLFGPVGDTSEIIQLHSWRANSKSGSDTLEISSWHILRDSTLYYIPQTPQAVFRTPWYGRTLTYGQSRSGKHSLLGDYYTGSYYLDGSSLAALDSSIEALEWVSFSPDEKLLALSVDPNGQGPPADTIFPQVWVYHVDSMSAPPIVINFQKSFCMYSFWGIDAEFITDSTLAVSMHHDGDLSSPLWEITLGGRIVRQLTFLPEFSGVSEPTILLKNIRVFPNPATNELQILSGPSGTARLYDLLGREVLETNDDGSGVTLDVSKLPNGTYFLRMGTQSAEVVIAR